MYSGNRSTTTPRPLAVCLMTPPGRAAIASVRLWGNGADQVLAAFFSKAKKPPALRRVLFGTWGGAGGEEVVVCRVAEDAFAIHCHGGSAAAAAIIKNLTDAGCQNIHWPQWAQECAADALEAEARIALASAQTVETAAILLDQMQGALRRSIAHALGLLESGVLAQQGRVALHHLLQLAPAGLHLTRPFVVQLTGPTNAGKSSLMNALVGYERAIVSSQAGTTRDLLQAGCAWQGVPLEIRDAAGLRATTNTIEQAGQLLLFPRLQEADLVLWVVDAALPCNVRPPNMLAENTGPPPGIPAEIAACDPLVVWNKIDLIPESTGPARADADHPAGLANASTAICRVSATQGHGLAELQARILSRLRPQVPEWGEGVPFADRHMQALTAALDALPSDPSQPPGAPALGRVRQILGNLLEGGGLAGTCGLTGDCGEPGR